MKVKELIEALKQFDPELEVYGYCDHGQTAEKVSYPGEIYVESADHTLWDGFASSQDDIEESGYTVKAVIL